MKITLPDDYSEVTVGQFQSLYKLYEKEEDAYVAQRRCIELLANLEEGALQHASWESIESASAKINWLISEPDPFTLKLPLVNTFELQGKRYGFIPDWSKLTVGEYADLETLCRDGMFSVLEKVCACLFREIVEEVGDQYTIRPYTLDKRRHRTMLSLPMNIAVGAIVFFCHIEEELISTTQRYSREMEKGQEMDSIPNGDGSEFSTNWLKAIFYKWMPSKIYI
tara:strand:- start:3 stop:674 length:672 start_codon:yes stop_codon:yes gene_type:complete